MYGLLTGLMVFHELFDYEEVKYCVGTGDRPYIDPRYKERSLAEEKLVEIIECSLISKFLLIHSITNHFYSLP